MAKFYATVEVRYTVRADNAKDAQHELVLHLAGMPRDEVTLLGADVVAITEETDV